ncbi:hypothetical protein GWK47_048812 [Chionoecetes opilio]|uniref:RNase H type-1 domain-containing protein n=1 Tax=Chionoecetes opilio TaxID=41210 RepID=A0A8J5CUI2_CHIOP|nr:hypothetical protein GWK47_048812 [Chionoecetes opilio]
MAQLPPGMKIVAIRSALHHALESHSPHVIIHTDSKSSIQALRDTQPQDNIHLLTSTLLLAQRLAARGCKITLNWVPSHVGLSGNEAADRAAKSAAALPSPTTAVLPNLSQTLLKIKSASHALSRQQHEATVALSSPSASWYPCCNSLPPTSPRPILSPHTYGTDYTVSPSVFPVFRKSARALWTSPVILPGPPPPLHSNTTS